MPALELLPLGEQELLGRLSESRRELLNLRFQLATGQLDNSARIGQVRREVARILTVLRDREIAEAEGRTIAPAPPRRARREDQDESATPKNPRARRSTAPDEDAPAEVAEDAPADDAPAEVAEVAEVAAEDTDVEEEA